MRVNNRALAGIIGLLLAAAAARPIAAKRDGGGSGGGGRGSFLGSRPRTWLFVADPGTFSGHPENAVYLENLVGAKRFPTGSTSCPDARYGTIMGLPVAVVTTGIGPMASALCVYDIMESFGHLVKEIIYSGTSGWSPQVGGILNEDDCSSANTQGRPNHVGDVCVSPLSVNWDCRKASWTMTAEDYAGGGSNQCSSPSQQFDASNEALFGQCMFPDATEAQLALSDEILASSTAPGARSELPARGAQLVANEEAFWAAMSEGTGVTYEPPFDPQALPHVYSYNECAEIDSQYFWSGAPWDMVARRYVAATLRAGLADSDATPQSVIAVSAMEAIGLSQGMARYYAKHPSAKRVAFTNVRGMSNQAVQPVARAAPQSSVWINGEEVPEDFVNGYRYAIQSSASVVLSTLQARCRAAGGSAAKCAYAIGGGSGGRSAARRSGPK